jgi:Flp pilus assembly protein TadG
MTARNPSFRDYRLIATMERELQGALRLLWALRLCRSGVAIVEFAIVAPFLVLLLLPLVDLGMGFYVKTQLMTAAEAGAQYAFVHGWSGTNSTTQTSILSAVSSAMSLTGIQSTPAPVLACGCANGTTITYSSPGGAFTQASCATQTACTGGQKPAAYVTVNTQVDYAPLFGYWLFGGTATLTAGSTVRVQ